MGEAATGRRATNGPVILLRPQRHGDARGWFMETWSEAWAATCGITARFVQDNHSFSQAEGTVRGFTCNARPTPRPSWCAACAARSWTMRSTLRRGSPTYGRWTAARLTAEGAEQLFVPVGFAHGFVTLSAATEVAYKVSDIHAPPCEAGLAWDDPALRLDWPLPATGPVLSARDRAWPTLAAFDSPFAYDGEPLAAPDERMN
ncbi:dTDP-4-dehydrorhamnose 3,5-epimerase [Brevundimonas albigilva]|uniref:dTDP-4-dehydrorhamnose 3,5-epimerase family protein n=1 Tax=Brevundimonas albigilva TaxID=1312364 RepID=UPI00201B79EA|nr:dTDP-4-dehydrorhamnose 3,5-epimerase [Brevundimonas albigilva]UQV17455.1 dTDP-4-dehydrorhamnose 3,5-epimerase [Brevundimonas albigilva]